MKDGRASILFLFLPFLSFFLSTKEKIKMAVLMNDRTISRNKKSHTRSRRVPHVVPTAAYAASVS